MARATVGLKIIELLTEDGRNPYRDWLDDHKSVGLGVWESRLVFGPGYRLYFGKVGNTVILLLCGGDKNRQSRDIRKAQEYLADYLEETKHGTKK